VNKFLRNLSICITSTILLLGCATQSAENKAMAEKKISTAKINTQLGLAYLERKDMERAKQKLLLALDEGPNIPETWYSLAYFLEMTNNIEDAKKHYLKALELAPRRGDTNNNYGTFLCRSGDYANAIHHFIVATKDPTYLETAAAFENAGLCALKIPDKTQAFAYFNKAVAYDPTRSVATAELSRLEA
jgi:type IV pilus assembly protein PilF